MYFNVMDEERMDRFQATICCKDYQEFTNVLNNAISDHLDIVVLDLGISKEDFENKIVQFNGHYFTAYAQQLGETYDDHLYIQRTQLHPKKSPDYVYLLCGEYAVKEYFEHQNNLQNLDISQWEKESHSLERFKRGDYKSMLLHVQGFFEFTLISAEEFNELNQLLNPKEDATA